MKLHLFAIFSYNKRHEGEKGGRSMGSLISADNTWALWAIIAGGVAISIWLEQKYKWAAKISGAIIALVMAMLLANFGIIPTDAPVYDTVWGYVVPLAIPLLLLNSDIRKIWKESGRLLIIFLIGSIGTVAGAIIAYSLLHNYIPELGGIAGMMTGSYIGGGVNFAALADAFGVSGEMISAATVADNLLMGIYFFVLLAIPGIKFFREKYTHPYQDEVEAKTVDAEEGKTLAAAYWGRKEISLRDIAFAGGTTFIIVCISGVIANFLSTVIPTSNPVLAMCNALFGNKYLIITTLTMVCATVLPDFFGNIKGTQELGTYLIYFFLFVIGVPASIPVILRNAPLLLVFTGIMVLINMIVMFVAGKIGKFNLEEIILASNANIGGPTTAAAMAISKGWTKLVGPVLLVGTLGYVIGTYFGLIIGNIFV